MSYVRALGWDMSFFSDIAHAMAVSPIGRPIAKAVDQEAAAHKVAPPQTVTIEREVMSFPWHLRSNDTIALQSEINAYLLGKSMCPIMVDGSLGGSTCGALKFLADGGMDVELPEECKAHTAEFNTPRRNTGGCANAPAIAPPVQPPRSSAASTGGPWLICGATLTIAIFLMLRR